MTEPARGNCSVNLEAELAALGARRRRELEAANGPLASAAAAFYAGAELVAAERRAGHDVNVREAARLLGVSRQALHARLRDLDVPRTGTRLPDRGTSP